MATTVPNRTPLIVSPHLYLGDVTGRPLDYGMVYFGEPNKDPEFYPIKVFSDKELTAELSQPVRTKGGFLNQFGDIVEVFAYEGVYSVKVLDQYGRKVFYKPEVAKQTIEDATSDVVDAAQVEINRRMFLLDGAIAIAAAAGAGANGWTDLLVKTSNGRTQADKNADFVSVMDFYDPDNDNDFTNALQRAVNSDVPVIDGGGKTYDISAPIVCTRSNVGLQNMVIKTPVAIANAAGQPDYNAAIKFQGSIGNPVAITSMASAYGIVVADVSGFAADDYVYLSSTADWSIAAQQVKLGEILQIASIDAATKTIKFYTSAISNKYGSEINAQVSKLNMLQNISLSNVEVVGQDETISSSIGIIIDKCVNVSLTDVNTRFFDHTHILFRRCANVRVFGGQSHKTGDTDGVDYGLSVVEGCFDVVVNGFVGQACRHAITVGGNNGVSKSLTFANCRSFSSRDAAFDAHPAASNVSFLFCESWQSDDNDREQDAIAAQCAVLTVLGCKFVNFRRHGIAYTPQIAPNAFNDSIGISSGLNVFRNNQVDLNPAVNTIGLNVGTTPDVSPIEYVTSNGDQFSKFNNTVQIIADGATISNISINNLSTTRPSLVRSIFIQAKTADINKVTINNCNLTNSSAYEVVYLQGSAIAKVKHVSFTGNVIDGMGTSSAALRLLYCQDVTEGLNQHTGVTRFLVSDNTSTGVKSETKRVAKVAWAGATIANGAQATIAVTLNNVAYGDIIAANLSVANQGCNVFAYMSAANTVTVVVQNNTGASKTIVACDVIVVANRFIP